MNKKIYKISALLCAFAAFLFLFGGCEMIINRDADYTLVVVDEVLDINAIFADCENNHFVIAPSPDGNFKLTYYKAEYYPLSHQIEEGKLSLTGKYTKLFVGYVSTQISAVTLYLPQSFFGDIDITTSNGGISIEQLNFDDLYLSTSNGGVKLSRCALNKADITTSNGKIQLENVTAENRINVKSSNGALNLKYVKAADIEGKTSNGAVDLTEIDCGGDIALTTSNGKIEASILGEEADYTLYLHTSNGNISLSGYNVKNGKSGSGEKTLDFSTSNGKITIKFLPRQ